MIQQRHPRPAHRGSKVSRSRASSVSNSNSNFNSSYSSVKSVRTVKQLRLSKTLTIPDDTTVLDACRRMAARRVDAALLTNSSAFLSGIITDKDVATRVIAEGLKPEETLVSKVMTRNPIFVMGDSLAVDALQKMVQGKFRHLPVVEKGEVIALLDITKCLYDAISQMEKAVEKGNAIAAAVEDVERQWGSTFTSPSNFVDLLREKLFHPSLGSIITENYRVVTVWPSDSVSTAAKRMQEHRVNSVVIMKSRKPQGILTSKDILMRVVSLNLNPNTTLVEKVMTPNPECATVSTTIVDALHIMHDGRFLHLPVVDKDGFVVACVDVLQLTHAAVAMVGNATDSSDTASTMMQKLWDSAFTSDSPEDEDSYSDLSCIQFTADPFASESAKYSLIGEGNSFAFKLLDDKGRLHRFTCSTESLSDLTWEILQRAGNDMDETRHPHILYEDDEGDHVLLVTDSDLVAAVNHAKLSGWKALKLRLDYMAFEREEETGVPSRLTLPSLKAFQKIWGPNYTTLAASGVVIVTVSVLFYLKRPNA